MNAHDLVNRLLEADPDEVDPKHYVRTAWPQERLRYLDGARVTYTQRGNPVYKATVVNQTGNSDFVFIHVDGWEPSDDLYVHVDNLQPLAEAVDPDVSSKGYAQHLARRVSVHQLIADLRAAGIHSPESYGQGTGGEMVTLNGLFFGYGEEGAKHLVQSVLKKHGLDIHYWGFEPYDTWSCGNERLKSAPEQRWWKFVADVPRIHFSVV